MLKITKSAIMALTMIAIIVMCTACSPDSTDGEKANNPSISEIAVDNLDLEVTPGIGIIICYESDENIIFYGYFGLFGYDLGTKQITFSVDFVKSNGQVGSVQGSHGIAVDVSSDGQTIMLYDYDVETETRGETCYIDIPTLTYSIQEYQPMENIFSQDIVIGEIAATTEIGALQYVRGDTAWSLFE